MRNTVMLFKFNFIKNYSNYVYFRINYIFRFSWAYLKYHITNAVFFVLPFLKPPPLPTIMTLSHDFVERHKQLFFENVKKEGEWNKSIDKIFYLKKDYNNYMKDANNELEEKWKTKILYINTPRGNVMLSYDSFKLAFMYYCDCNLSYDILNALAMDYVIKFRCLDFFVDNVCYEENKSPFIQLYFREDADKKEKPEKKENKLFEDNKNVFIKKKVVKKEKNVKKDEKKEPEREIIRNKFVNMGKITNFSFLQKQKVDIPTNGFNANWTKNLKKENKLQRELFNYKDFKKLKEVTV